MATTANEPAFSAGVPEGGYHYPGLTIRDYFAAMAMQGLLAGHGTERRVYHESVASEAVKSADALLNELSKPQP